MQNKIVVRYMDGSVKKGMTNDFMPNKEVFHLTPMDSPPDTKPAEILIRDLKAVFFVKDFTGNKDYQDNLTADPSKPTVGRKITVVFRDGETLAGTTQGFQHGRAGFFVFPFDAKSNIDRCFVITAATSKISFM